MTKNILICCRSAPYGTSLARETVDMILAYSVFEQNLSVAFIGDGVWQLVNQQHTDAIEQKNLNKLISSLTLYDVNNLYIEQDSLYERQLSADELVVQNNPVPAEHIKQLMHSADIVINL